ncbi:MAG: biliverdin-producing heme oxygenase [Methylococcaceae bacterium]
MTLLNKHQQPNTNSDLRTLLRSATHTFHVQLNQHPLLTGLTKPDYPLANYRKLLLVYFHLYQALEDRISQFFSTQSCAFDYSARYKLPWLLKDITFFKDDPHAAGNVPCPAMILPEIVNMGQLIGVLYVLEGSTLGGQLVFRSLVDYQSLNRNEGACFFNGYSERTPLLWQDFLSFSDIISGDDAQCQAAKVAACQTFQLFKQMLDDQANQEKVHL